MNTRIAYTSAIVAFVVWGLVPLFYQYLSDIAIDVILAHRIVWSSLLLMLAMPAMGITLRSLIRSPRDFLLSSLAGLVMNLSWFGFVYAITSGQVATASLAFFITPLLVFIAGILLFRERPHRIKWIAFAFMIAAIVVFIATDGTTPWLSLAIATMFAAYFSIKKLTKNSATESLVIEHIVFAIPALCYILFTGLPDTLYEQSLLFITAPLQLISILLLTLSISRTELNKLSVIQYIEPILHMMLAVWVFDEFVSDGQIYATYLIIFGVLLLSVHALRGQRLTLASNEPG